MLNPNLPAIRLTNRRCNRWTRFQVIEAGVTGTVSQVLMGIRVYAVSDRNKVIGFGLSAWVFVQLIFGIVLTTLSGYHSESGCPLVNLALSLRVSQSYLTNSGGVPK
jgi:hypothetical protein